MAAKKNVYVQKMLECARTINTDSNAPFIGMVENLALAYMHEGFRDQKKFKAMIQSLRTEKGRATLAENRLSESWSIGELGLYKCAPRLFKAVRELPELPSMTGMYDIACSVRGTGSFADKKYNAGKGLAWDKVREDAPTVAQLQSAMKDANKARNASKDKDRQTFAEWVAGVVKRLEKHRDGKATTKNAKDETITLPAITSSHLKDAITSLTKLRDEKPTTLRVIKGGKNAKAA